MRRANADDLAGLDVGSVVYCEGSSAILGDVTEIEWDPEDPREILSVTVRWRETETTEEPWDLIIDGAP